MKITSDVLIGFLDEMYENPVCELNYNKDYELLIATVLSAQSTDKRVNVVTEKLFGKYNIKDIANMDINLLEKIIKPVGTFHKKAIFIKDICNLLLKDYNGIVPNDRKYLESLPGVGRKTCNVVLSHLFGVPAIAVDTHVERVSKRLCLAKQDDMPIVVEKKLMSFFPKENWSKVHLQLVLFGRYHCKSIKPLCDECKLKDFCLKNKTMK